MKIKVNKENQMYLKIILAQTRKLHTSFAITEKGTSDSLTTSFIPYYVIVNLSEGSQLPPEGSQTSLSTY